jgi:hypothetical protein
MAMVDQQLAFLAALGMDHQRCSVSIETADQLCLVVCAAVEPPQPG